MSAKRLFKMTFCLTGALAIVAATGFGTVAAAAAKEPVKYYFKDLCTATNSCNEVLMKVPAGKRFDIGDASCRAYLEGSGEAVKLAIWITKKGNLKSLHDFVPAYTGMQGSYRYYVGGRILDTWAGSREKLQFEGSASANFASVHCTVTGHLVTVN